MASGTPSATYADATTDVLSFLRERIESGLKVEVDRGNLINDLGYIQVFNAAPSLERDLKFPLVTIHMESEEPSIRGMGDEFADYFDSLDDEWVEVEGWLASVRLTVIGWSLNGDERIELRKALRRIVVGNLPVFASKGWQQIEFSQQDIDAVNGEYAANIYQVMNTFTCVAPVVITSGVDLVRDISSRRSNE